jgi:TonB family protein
MVKLSRCQVAWVPALAVAIGLTLVGDVYAQSHDTLSLRAPSLSLVVDSASTAVPASHRTAAEKVDRPVRVRYCPEPAYPTALGQYGFGGRVVLRFVVDTSGLAELDDIVVSETSNPGFVESARRTVAKCRYDPAMRDGRPVRFLVMQPIRFVPHPKPGD